MIAENNRGNGDKGVTDVLIALSNQDDKVKIAELNKIRKDSLTAGLGFMDGASFTEAKAKFKGVRVDELRAQILARYNNSIPRICNDCNGVYNNGDMTTKITYCFICDSKICPTCVPAQSSPPNGYVPICGFCRDSYAHDRHREEIVTAKDQVNDKSVLDESFLDATIKSRGTSTPKKTGSSKDPIKDPEGIPAKKTDKVDAVCSHYLKGRCKHGRVGSDCKWNHPKLCFSFIKNGSCVKDECLFFHPNLCRHSKKKEVCPKEEKCRYYHTKICRKKKEVIDDDKKDGVSEEELRVKITKEIKEKDMKEKQEKEMRDRIAKENEKGEKTKSDNPSLDFQKETVKEPDILSLLLTLQAQVADLQTEAKERKEREKYQNQYQAWYPQYHQ